MTILDPEQLQKWNGCLPNGITIIGVGGSGSRVAEGLVRTGFGTDGSRITLIDGDCFEKHNLKNQLAGETDIGKKKVSGVAEQLKAIRRDIYVYEIGAYIKKPYALRGVVFLCLDSMYARRQIMEHSLENNDNVDCVIDPRLDSGVGVSYCFDPCSQIHQDCWWLYWHPDDEAENVAGCGGTPPTIASIFGTASLALKQFEHLLNAGTAHGIANRVYQDFDQYQLHSEVWPS